MTKSVPLRVSPWLAVLPMLFARKRFIDLAVAHSFALCAENQQYREVIARGEFPSEKWEAEARSNLSKGTTALVHSFWSSLAVTCCFVGIGLAAAMLLGKLSPDWPLDYGKVLAIFGGSLASWATLFELNGVMVTYSGEQLHELAHPVLFRAIFLPGIALAILGQVW